MKKIGKTTRPFTYDLKQIPYHYTVEVANKFKWIDNSEWKVIKCQQEKKNYPQL